jgi:hypothetical protein
MRVVSKFSPGLYIWTPCSYNWRMEDQGRRKDRGNEKKVKGFRARKRKQNELLEGKRRGKVTGGRGRNEGDGWTRKN